MLRLTSDVKRDFNLGYYSLVDLRFDRVFDYLLSRGEWDEVLKRVPLPVKLELIELYYASAVESMATDVKRSCE